MDGNICSVENGGTILLRHGQTAVFDGLPVGTGYSVVEIPVTGYTVVPVGDRGVITEDGASAIFVNYYGKNPRTGDERPVMLYALLSLAALTAAGAVLLSSRKGGRKN